MNDKIKNSIKDILLLAVLFISYCFHVIVSFCGMRGSHVKDMCDVYAGGKYFIASYFGIILIVHGVVAIIIIIDGLLNIFSTRKIPFINWVKKIPFVLILSSIVWYLIINLF